MNRLHHAGAWTVSQLPLVSRCSVYLTLTSPCDDMPCKTAAQHCWCFSCRYDYLACLQMLVLLAFLLQHSPRLGVPFSQDLVRSRTCIKALSVSPCLLCHMQHLSWIQLQQMAQAGVILGATSRHARQLTGIELGNCQAGAGGL